MQEILAQEVETLKEIYLNDLTVLTHFSDDYELKFNLTPTTGEKIHEKWVSMTLCFYLSSEYPSDIPIIKIFNPRGLLEKHTNRILECLKNLAENRIGFQMIFELVEQAKEMLTIYNTPHVHCMICLEDLSTCSSVTFVKTNCLHYFHRNCLHRYVQFIRDNLINMEDKSDRVEATTTVSNKLICPICREDISEIYSNAGYNFINVEDPVPDNSFVYVPDENMLQQQVLMKNLIEVQRSKGGIIDQDMEKKKFDLPKDFVYQGLKQKEQLEKEISENFDKEKKINNHGSQKINLNCNKRVFKSNVCRESMNNFTSHVNNVNHKFNRDQYSNYRRKCKYIYDDDINYQDKRDHCKLENSNNKNQCGYNRDYNKNYDSKSGKIDENHNTFFDSKNSSNDNLLSIASKSIDDIVIDISKKCLDDKKTKSDDIVNKLYMTEVNETKVQTINSSIVDIEFDNTSQNFKLPLNDDPIKVVPVLDNTLKQDLGKHDRRNFRSNHKYNNSGYTNFRNKSYYNSHHKKKILNFEDISKGDIKDKDKNNYLNNSNENIEKTFNICENIVSKDEKGHQSTQFYDSKPENCNKYYLEKYNGFNVKNANSTECHNSNKRCNIGVKDDTNNRNNINAFSDDRQFRGRKNSYNKNYSKANSKINISNFNEYRNNITKNENSLYKSTKECQKDVNESKIYDNNTNEELEINKTSVITGRSSDLKS